MPTSDQIAVYSNRVLQAAAAGTPQNPGGLPAALASLVLAQAKHETGNFSSDAFVLGNNAFGYSYVPGGYWQLTTPNPASEGSRQMAAYGSLEDSVGEIIDWLYRRQSEGVFPALTTVTTPEQYATLLRSAGYYTAPLSEYVAGLQRWWQSGSTAGLSGGATGLVLLLLAGGLILSKRKKKSRYVH